MLFFLTLSFIILGIFYMCEKSKVNTIVTFIVTITTFYLIIFPKSSIDSILNGVDLFLKSVFPTLFPFLILTNILINYGGINIFGKIFGKILSRPLRISQNSVFPLLISFICGYPLGTKYLNDIYTKKLIGENEFIRMVNIASNASPLFLIGTVGASMLQDKTLGYILLIGNYLSCIIISFIIPYRKDESIDIHINSNIKIDNFGNALKSALENAIKTCAIVGGFIIIFSLIKEILINNYYTQVLLQSVPILKSIIIGIFEITNGIDILSNLNILLPLKLSIISALCTFSGACIILQCYSFVHKNKAFNIWRYISYKIIQSIISFLITLATCLIFI